MERADTLSEPGERELDALAARLKQVETEYTMYFAGRSPRPPVESRARLDQAMRALGRTHLPTSALRFRFGTLQARYVRFVDLWDRGVRAREEGRPGPLGRQAPTRAVEADASVVHGVGFRSLSDAASGVRALYDALMRARQLEGRQAVPFDSFAALVRRQMTELQAREPGGTVWFTVTRREGKVSLSARVDSETGTSPA